MARRTQPTQPPPHTSDTTTPQPSAAEEPDLTGFRLIPEHIYQTALRLTESSTISGPAAQVADFVNGLRACQRTHAEPFPHLVPALPDRLPITREQARAAAGEDLDD